jgi:predicted ester cyclase
MSEANKQLSRRFTELFGSDDETLADRVFAEDVVFHGTSGDGELRGIDAVKAFVAGYRRAFPDAHSTVEDQVAEGDKVVTRWQARGANTEGRAFVMDGVTIERIADHRIAEIWVARDELGLMRQLGGV